MAGKVTEEEWRAILTACVDVLQLEFARRKKPPVVPLLYTRGKGDTEVCGASALAFLLRRRRAPLGGTARPKPASYTNVRNVT